MSLSQDEQITGADLGRDYSLAEGSLKQTFDETAR